MATERQLLWIDEKKAPFSPPNLGLSRYPSLLFLQYFVAHIAYDYCFVHIVCASQAKYAYFLFCAASVLLSSFSYLSSYHSNHTGQDI